MLQRTNKFSILIVLIGICCSGLTFAASKADHLEKTTSIHKIKNQPYAGGEGEQQAGATSELKNKSSNPITSASSVSPGIAVGNTWYDYQHNGSMGRMIDIGNNSNASGKGIVHFSWMNLPDPYLVGRHYAYSRYNSNNASISAEVIPNSTSDYAGYVNVQSTEDGRSIVGGHNNQGAGNQAHFYWDVAPGSSFPDESRVPDSVAGFHNPGEVAIWPKFAYQEGTLDVMHVFTSASVGDGLQYFRKVGNQSFGVWDPIPYMVDTAFTLSQVIVASKTSDKVAMGWMANLNYDINGDQFPPGVCDTCSGISLFNQQWDNDVYYQISHDQGATWEPRVNVTKYRLGETGYRSYTDMSILLDDNDIMHVAWGAIPWAAELTNVVISDANRIFHYSEDIPFIRTVANGEWEGDCTAGGWNLTMSKMSLSECNGKLYTLWSQINDVPNGITDDCAARGGPSSANGDLYIAISSDGGATWDVPRNLTNSRTPGCDPANGGADCESDMWASMARTGRQNRAGEDWSGAVVVDPSGGGYAGDHYLDIQYVHDRDAGGIIKNEGSWQLSNINWFRMACVDPIPNPQINLAPKNIDAPIWTKPSVQLDQDLTIENNGTSLLTYSTTIIEDNGPSGWLAMSGLSGSVPSGLSNIETGTIHLNNGGVQTTEIGLVGRIVFTSNAPSSPDTLEVNLLVLDTIGVNIPDTISGYLSLLVSNTGNYGNSGAGKVNLDYIDNGLECDTTGNADVYLFDASPVILTVNGGDTTGAWSIYSDGWLSPNGFKPQGGQSKGSEATYNLYKSGTFTTPDSTVAFEQTFYAPTATAANYMIKTLKVWSHDGASHNGLRIGDAIDYDIPSDSGGKNSSSFDIPHNLIYQIGAEYDTDDTLANGTVNPAGSDCVDADRRFGGFAFIKSMVNGVDHQTYPYSAYTARNDSFIFPTGNFIPTQLYEKMGNSGFWFETDITDQHMVICYEPYLNLGASDTIVFYTVLATVYDGTASDMGIAVDAAEAFAIANNYWLPDSCDMQMPGDYDGNGTIGINDLVMLTAFIESNGTATQPNTPANADVDGDCDVDQDDQDYLNVFLFSGGPAPVDCTCVNPLYICPAVCCHGLRGNVNGSFEDCKNDSSPDVSDLVYLVAFSFQGGDAPPCPDEADVNGSGSIDVSDLVYLVAYSFQGGPPPLLCP